MPFQGELVPVKGLLDLREEGYGFLRTSGYLPSAKDVYVSVSQARRFSLRRGDAVEGAVSYTHLDVYKRQIQGSGVRLRRCRRCRRRALGGV